jgi:hypothetical protein
VSPEQRASAAILARLRGEIATLRKSIVRHARDACDERARTAAPDRRDLAASAFAVHAWYTGLESIFELVARDLDGAVPHGDAWHRELLRQMAVEVPGARPAVVPPEAHSDLDELRKARHFFRHGSVTIDLDPARTQESLDRLLRVAPIVEQALDDLSTFLDETLRAVPSS